MSPQRSFVPLVYTYHPLHNSGWPIQRASQRPVRPRNPSSCPCSALANRSAGARVVSYEAGADSFNGRQALYLRAGLLFGSLLSQKEFIRLR